tara:strand:+ start:3293 stop:4534 length:1242 start_codon:yes stop_codon:yes gene_type:complete
MRLKAEIMNIYHLDYIETPRLRIRPVQIGDEKELNQAINRSLPMLQRWMPWAKDPSLQTTREFIQDGVLDWQSGEADEFPMVVIHKEDNKIISASGFNDLNDVSKPYFEMGYWIDSGYQGQGLITELVIGLTRYTLEALQATRVQIRMQAENTKSVAVAQRCGFTLEAKLKNYCLDCESGLPADSLLFACCDSARLPALEVKWFQSEKQYKVRVENKDITDKSFKLSLPILQTKRLKLMPPDSRDAQAFQSAVLASVNELGPWFLWAKANMTLEQAQQHINNRIVSAHDIYAHDHLFLCVWAHGQNDLLGEVSCKILDWGVSLVQIHFWFDTRYTGQGYAIEAVAEVVRFAFIKLNAKRVEVNIPTQNDKSLGLIKRLGFNHEGTLQNHAKNFMTNEVMSSELFSLTELADYF